MWLIVDSGSTKTDWALALSAQNYSIIKTAGINPVVQSEEQIRQNIQHELLLKMHGAPKVLSAYISTEQDVFPKRHI